MQTIPSMPTPVAQVFESFAAAPRERLHALRALIYETAASTEGVGRLEETLKWGEPSYLTPQTKSGSTIRLGWKETEPKRYGMYFNCQTRLVATFRDWFDDELVFEGNRAIVLSVDGPQPTEALARCIQAALTYHRWK